MKKFLITFGIIFTSINLFITFKGNKEIKPNEDISINKSTLNNLAMMLETDANSKKYEATYQNEWPTSEYKFNSKLSKCENGGSLSWDYKSNNVIMEGTTSDKCYIYFDKVVTVSDYCTSGDNLADCIKTFGNVGYDKSNIYIHDDSLKNGANDNSYRFAGSSDYVNNYVCFGSNEETCPSDNLYRIIGVFEGQVKLIKADLANSNLLGTDGAYSSETFSASDYSNYKGNLTSISTYYWNNSTNKNTWSESNLNTINLNTNYLNNLGESWANMIDETLWQVGGNTGEKIQMKAMYEVYQNEIVNSATNATYNAKIGLMYVSDYGYAAPQKYWTYKAFDQTGSWNSDKTIWSGYDYVQTLNENWLITGVYEWTITPLSDVSNMAFGVGYTGALFRNYVYGNHPVRPSFYLKSSINYLGGSGTKDSPIKVGVALSEYIKNQYVTQGENGIYLHNGTIKSGDTVIDANDGSYRYTGANPNNYVCFGTDESTCPSNNLYRIIGLFGDNVKLIKADYANSEELGTNGDYAMQFNRNSSYYKGDNSLSSIGLYYFTKDNNEINVFRDSLFNTVNLNTNYLNNLGESWSNKITLKAWHVGASTYANIAESSMYQIYQNEIVNPSDVTTVSTKVGLIYISDYGYAASPTYWTYYGFKKGYPSLDYRASVNDNWLYLGLSEWAMTLITDKNNTASGINEIGFIGYDVSHNYAVRPCFYLNTKVSYTGEGNGQKSSPLKIK